MADIIQTTLPQFYEAEKSLYQDLLEKKLTYSEATIRYSEMCNFIPSNVSINPFRLNQVIKEQFGHTEEFQRNRKIYTIKIK